MAGKTARGPASPQTLADFVEEFTRYFSRSVRLKCYRGRADSSWPNTAGIFRPELKGLLENEKTAIRELISVQPHAFSSDKTMFDKLVRMQHFGLPTRLLDVSQNALVALYFATDPGPAGSEPTDGIVSAFSVPREVEKYYDSDSVSCIANLANMTAEEKNDLYSLRGSLTEDISTTGSIEKFNKASVMERLLQLIRAEKPYFQPRINPINLFVPYYVHPKMSNARILAQSGAFILYGFIRPRTMFIPYEIEETKFVVPHSKKKNIRRALDNIGINESTLFPEIDKAAARIRHQYDEEKETG